MKKQDKHIIVIGAGIIGLCCAYYLNKKGFKVTIIDNTDGKDNCSYGNAGHIVPSHIIPLASPGIVSQGLRWMLKPDSPFYIKPKLSSELISWGLKFKNASTHTRVKKSAPVLNKLLMDSRYLVEQLVNEERINAGFNNKGLLIYCKTEKAFKEEVEVAKLARKYGQRVDMLDAQQTQHLNPDLELDILGALWFRNDACVTPHVLMSALKDILTSRGVEMYFNQKVNELLIGNGSIKAIKTQDGAFQGDEYVLAAGSWTGQLLKPLGIKLPMQAGKGYSFVLPTEVTLNTSVSFAEARVVAAPMLHGIRFAGTMEINGMDLSVNPKRIQGIIDSIIRYFPQFTYNDFENIEPWAGLRPCSPDGLPYIGRTKKYNNLLVASGHAMLGLSMGPITGKLISQIVANEPLDVDLSLLEVDRYGSIAVKFR